MCLAGLAFDHPAADLLMEYATIGCPTKTGKNWTMTDLEDAIEVGPHVSALDPEAMAQLQAEVYEKEGSPRTSEGGTMGRHQDEPT